MDVQKIEKADADTVVDASALQSTTVKELEQVDGIEVIDQSKIKDGTYEIRLQNGKKMFVHDEAAYDFFYDDGRSFESLGEGDKIAFTSNFKIHRDGLSNMKTPGNQINSNPMAVYHNHVMWTYAYTLTVVKKEEGKEPWVFLEIVSVGPNFSRKQVQKGGVGDNSLPKQTAPQIIRADLSIVDGEREMEIPLSPKNDGYVSQGIFPMQHFTQLMRDDRPIVELRLRVEIHRDYFNLHKYIDLSEPKIDAPANTIPMVAAILKGEKVAGCDAVITVGDGSPRDYHVHKAVLAARSANLHAVFALGKTLGDEVLKVSHEDRVIMPKLRAEDMKVLIPLLYRNEVVLPSFLAVSRVGRVLGATLPMQTILDVFKQWDRLIAKRTLDMDKADHEATFLECARLATAIFSAPYGAFPAAKRAVIATMADAVHQSTTADQKDLLELLNKPENNMLQTKLMEQIVYSVEKFRMVVGGVHKVIC